MRSRIAFLLTAGAFALATPPAAAQPVPPPGTQKVHPGPTLPPLPGLAKIVSVTWNGTCGKAGRLVVAVRNTGGTAIGCHAVVSISKGDRPGGAVAGTAEFTGLAPGETKTFTILVERVFDCCPRDCWVVTLIFDPDCKDGQPWDRTASVVCVAEPAQASLLVSPISLPR